MKILLLTDRMDVGGAETHVVQLARELQRNRHTVLLWCSGGKLAGLLEHEGVRVLWQKPPSRNPLSLFVRRWHLARLVKKERIEVLHAHTRLTAQLIRGLRHRGCAEVVTIHARFRSGKLLSKLSYWGNTAIAVSEDLRAYTSKTYQLPTERIKVIPNGIDCDLFPNKREPHTGTHVLFASRLDADCALGADLLCALAPRLHARYPDLRLFLAGGGSEQKRLSLAAARINQSLGVEVLRVLGRVDDMPSLLQSQDIFVGVSRAAMEAAASGCAVILCGNEGYLGIPEESDIAYAALSNFCARGEPLPDTERLFCDLCRLLDQPSLRDHSAAVGADFVKTQLDAKRLCRMTEQVYRQSIPHKAHRCVLLGGYFGCGNLGDDAILQGILHEWRTHHRTLAPVVLSGSAHRDRKRLGVRTVPRKNPFSVAVALLRSRLFVLGGGSLLQNRTGDRSLFYYLGLLRISRLFRRPSALYASGIGPLLGESAALRVRSLLESVSFIGLRDEQSRNLLCALGLSPATLSVGADACFLLSMPPASRAQFLRYEAKIPQTSPLLGIVLRGGESEATLSSILSVISSVCRSHLLTPLFLVLDRKHDLPLTQRTATTLGAVCLVPTDPQDALALFATCRAVLSMRLHGLLLSVRASTPALAICTDDKDTKIPAFAHSAALPCLFTSSLSEPDLSDSLVRLIEQADTHHPRLCALAAEMQKNAQKGLAKLLQIVYNER